MKPIKAAIVSIESFTLNDDEKSLLNKYNPLGVTLFLRNIKTPEQIKKLVYEIKEVVEREDVLICVDQEGGRVARLQEPYFKKYMSQRALGSFDETEAKRISFLQALLISDELKKVGINLNYAPCIDVLHNETGRVLKSRCFCDDEQKVTLLAREMVTAYHQNGVVSCLKHAPGHGLAHVDPHLSLPIIDLEMKDLEKDFYPFKMLASQAVSMMTAHILLSAIDDKPVTQSKKSIDTIIRGKIGFDGFLISDAIDMKALKGSLSEKTKASLDAGCDAVCYCMGEKDGLKEVLISADYLKDESLLRFEKMKVILNRFHSLLSLDVDVINEYQDFLKKAPIIHEDYDAVEVLNQLKL